MKRKKRKKRLQIHQKNTPGNMLPANTDQELHRALDLHRSGRCQDAKALYQKILKRKPNIVMALSNLASILKREGKLVEALALIKKALKLAPDVPELHNNLGNAYTDLQQNDKAMASFRRAVSLRENYAVAYNNMGSLCKTENNYEEAVNCFGKAIKANPSYAEAYDNLGRALLDTGNADESIVFFEQALACRPDFDQAVSNIVFASMKTCRWDNIKTYGKALDRITQDAIAKSEKPVEDPFLNISRHDDPLSNAQVAKAWSDVLAKRTAMLQQPFGFENRNPGKKITIGYLSNNFHDHPMAHLMAGLFARHHLDRFHINLYSCAPDDGSGYRQQIQKYCSKFVDLAATNPMQAANQIYEDEVDILVDLMGYTKGHQLDISALRPAPIQVRYLGMAGTTGGSFFDYIIADRTVIPPEHRRHYSERVVYLPHCYQVNNDEQVIAKIEFSRSDLGLPNEGFVFCSFNQPYKIEPIIFDCWMRILGKVPGSVLWFQGGQPALENNLFLEAKKRNISAERIIFADRLPKTNHLARLRIADLALDTRLISGAATTSDALWAGLPVITLKGRHFASRMSSSILSAIGLKDLVTSDLQAYENLAVYLASHPCELHKIKARLEESRLSMPLFDTRGFVQAIERTYELMWNRFVNGMMPQHLDLAE